MKMFINFKMILPIIALVLLNACGNKQTLTTVDEMVNNALLNTKPITVDELKSVIDNGEDLMLIDVREPEEYNAAFIPGALNIPRGVLEFKIGNKEFWEEAMLYMPLKDDKIVLYCKKGSRSTLAAEMLQQIGFKNVFYLEKGWKNWELTYPLIYEKNEISNSHNKVEVGGC